MSTSPARLAVALDLTDSRNARDWSIFLAAAKKGTRAAAATYGVHRMTVYRAKKRVLFALEQAKTVHLVPVPRPPAA